MSVGQLFIGAGIVGVALNVALNAVLPSAEGVIIHSLTYDAGYVLQDRTVMAESDFYANWAASVVDLETGAIVYPCEGSGAFGYQPGRKVAKLTLAEWVGNDACTEDVLVSGHEYELRAVWNWGGDTVAASGGFTR